LFFFACPKKNQKRTSEKNYIPFSDGISIKLLYYCGEGQGGLDVYDVLRHAVVMSPDQQLEGWGATISGLNLIKYCI
jgi:hypothetical protein